MTIKDRVDMALDASIGDEDTLDKLIAMAYYMGRESATREVSDLYTAHIAQQHKRAAACRYKYMAYAVVGPEQYLYASDYRGGMTEAFGDDQTQL